MNCPHCGLETREGSAFCTQCGRPLSGPVSAPVSAPPPPVSAPPPPVSMPPPAGVPAPGPHRVRADVVAAFVVLAALLGVGVVFLLRDDGRSPSGVQPQATIGQAPTEAPKAFTPTQPPPAAADCAQATHPAQGTVERKQILDGLRRHYGYNGLYTVQFVTVYRGWAYLEAAPFDQTKNETVGEFRGYLTRMEGRRWNWRWEGGTGAEAEGPGDPPYPSDFQGAARDVLRC